MSEDIAAKGIPATPCACGCGEMAGGFYRRTKYHPARYVRGHNRKGQTPLWTLPRVLEYQDRTCVPTEPIYALLRARYGDVAAGLRAVGFHKHGCWRMAKRARIRTESAERILRFLAGLPRTATLTERRETRRRMETARKRRYRAMKQEAS